MDVLVGPHRTRLFMAGAAAVWLVVVTVGALLGVDGSLALVLGGFVVVLLAFALLTYLAIFGR